MMKRLRESKTVYVLISLVLATLFWLYVRSVLDPTQPRWFYDVPVQVTGESVLTHQGLTIAAQSAEKVNLRVEAPASVLDSLLRNRSDFWVSIDVSKCGSGESTLTYSPNWPAYINKEALTIIDRNPKTITVNVEKLYTNTLPIEFQLRGKVADGYQAGVAAINPETVMISGAVEQVGQVAQVVAVLESEALKERFAGDLPLHLLDEKGEELTDIDITMSTATAYVVLPVVVEKEIPLSIKCQSGGGATERDARWEISPKSIVVAGAQEDVEQLDEIFLGSVDLSKVVGTNVISFPIALDSSVENVSGITSATVTVSISGLSTQTFNVENIQRINVPKGYSVTIVTQARDVVVRGREEDLAEIDVSQLRIVADMAEITTQGTYSVSAKVYLDANSSVGVIGDYSIIVNVSK